MFSGKHVISPYGLRTTFFSRIELWTGSGIACCRFCDLWEPLIYPFSHNQSSMGKLAQMRETTIGGNHREAFFRFMIMGGRVIEPEIVESYFCINHPSNQPWIELEWCHESLPVYRWFLVASLQKNLAAQGWCLIDEGGILSKWLEENSGQWRWPIWECRLVVGRLHDLHLNYECQLHDLFK